MAKIVRKYSKKALALTVIASFFVAYLSLIDVSQGAQVSSRYLLLSNNALSATTNLDFVFTVNNALATTGTDPDGVTTTLVLTIDPSFTMGGIDCGDVDIYVAGTASSISSDYKGGATVRTTQNCPGSATSWGLRIDSNVLTFYTPTAVATHVMSGTQMEIRIGSNASFQDTGAEWVTNPAGGEVSTHSISGTFGGTGDILTQSTTSVTVSATVAETLTFTISGMAGNAFAGSDRMNGCIPSGSTTDNGGGDSETVTVVTTTATTVPFGTVNSSSFYQGCQRLDTQTNAGGGYTIRTRENNSLRTTGGVEIPDTPCNASGCLNTPTTTAVWTFAGAATGFGISCTDATTSISCFTGSPNPNWASGANWAPVSNETKALAQGTSPGPFSGLTSATSVTVPVKIRYRLAVPGSQAAGTYTNRVSLIATPTF